MVALSLGKSRGMELKELFGEKGMGIWAMGGKGGRLGSCKVALWR